MGKDLRLILKLLFYKGEDCVAKINSIIYGNWIQISGTYKDSSKWYVNIEFCCVFFVVKIENMFDIKNSGQFTVELVYYVLGYNEHSVTTNTRL